MKRDPKSFAKSWATPTTLCLCSDCVRARPARAAMLAEHRRVVVELPSKMIAREAINE